MIQVAGYFVTGTDTGVGKTVISLGLMQLLQDRGLRVVGMKPVASGCERTSAGLRNADALQLQRQSNGRPDYAVVNPYAFEPPIAPHIAAARAGIRIELPVLRQNFRSLSDNADMVIVEGVGGWLVPLDEKVTMADFVRMLELPIILVVGIRLGCLNHAMLTARAIVADGFQLAGWIANIVPGVSDAVDENINVLESIINEPLLGIVPVLEDAGWGAAGNYFVLS